MPAPSCTIIGNWKMHKTIAESLSFVKLLTPFLPPSRERRVGLAVPYTALYEIRKQLDTFASSLWLGAQNISDEPSGAFTGEISASMVKDAGAQFVLLGHSERRHLFGESNQKINHKVKRALLEGLTPILCVGEKKGESRESVLQKQITEGLAGIDTIDGLLLAYEPVWAIGTGTPATAQEATVAHEYIQTLIYQRFKKKVPLLYGGSVSEENAGELLALPGVGGLLVGGASLKVELFSQIIKEGAI